MRKMLTWAEGAAGVYCVSHSDYSRLLVTKTAVCVNLGREEKKKKESSAAFTQLLYNPTWKGTAVAPAGLWYYISMTMFSGKPAE